MGLIYILTDQLMTILGSFCFEGENSRNLGRGCVAGQKFFFLEGKKILISMIDLPSWGLNVKPVANII